MARRSRPPWSGRRSYGRGASPLLIAAALVSAACSEVDLPTATPTSEMLPSMTISTAASGAAIQPEIISALTFHACALRTDGVVECWGGVPYNDDLGFAPPTRSAATGHHFIQVTVGYLNTCALREDGVAECWGSNSSGAAPPLRSAEVGHFTQLSNGGFHTCAVRTDGIVECWGANSNLQAPQTRSAASGNFFIQVSNGALHSCALRDDGVVECWGNNDRGQAPSTQSATTDHFTQLSSGLYHACALRSDGAVECWGDIDQPTPTKFAADGHTFIQVSSGGFHTCAVRDDGVVECWGDNSFDKAPDTRSAPVGNHYIQVAAGVSNTCALRNDGVAECWGSNSWQQTPATKSATSGVYGDPAADQTPPTIILTTPANGAVYLLNEVVLAEYACEDEPGGSGLATCEGDVATGTAIPTGTVGEKRFTVRATDAAGNEAILAHDYRVSYPFGGFLTPVNGTALNRVQAGRSIPIKFSLGGDHGLGILAAGSPASQPIDCTTSTPTGGVEPVATAGKSGLSYDAKAQQYAYIWKTEKGWAGSCRMLMLTLVDGSSYTAIFNFSK